MHFLSVYKCAHTYVESEAGNWRNVRIQGNNKRRDIHILKIQFRFDLISLLSVTLTHDKNESFTFYLCAKKRNNIRHYYSHSNQQLCFCFLSNLFFKTQDSFKSKHANVEDSLTSLVSTSLVDLHVFSDSTVHKDVS